MNTLEAALLEIEQTCGSGSVITDADVVERYARDESEVAPCIPDAVVRVETASDVAAVLRTATKYQVPVTPRAGGTGRVGGAVPVEGGIVMAFERMNRLKGIEAAESIAVAEPGLVLGDLHREVEQVGLFYPPDPNSWENCAIGGNVAANAGGPRAFKYGVTREYVLGMEVVTADGTVLKLGKRTTKGVTGYDLTALVVGSEGTLAIVTEVTLKLIPLPASVVTLLVFLPSYDAVELSVRETISKSIVPRCVELFDSITLEAVRPSAGIAIPEEARAMLLVELDGEPSVLDGQLERFGNAMVAAGALDVLVARHGGERERLWAARRELSHALRRKARYKLAEDVVVPRNRIAALLERCERLAARNAIVMPTYGHAGDGNLHVNFLWNDPEERPAVNAAIRTLFEEVVDMGGTLTGEHGLGVLKAPYLPIEQSPELIALQRRIKNVFDPAGILNPGKMFPPSDAARHGAC